MLPAAYEILVVCSTQIGSIEDYTALGEWGGEGDVPTTLENTREVRNTKKNSKDADGVENKEIEAGSHRKKNWQLYLFYIRKNDTSFHT
jgi:hypothetical protein